MKCENIKELMSMYIDNEINEVDKAKFEKHIAQCPQCKEEYEILKAIVLECSEIDEVELPQDFIEELHNKLIAAKANKPSKFTQFIRRANWKPAVGAVAAVLILAISINSLVGNKSLKQDQLSIGAADRGMYGIYNDAAAEPESAPAPAAVAPEMAKGKSEVSISFSEDISMQRNMDADQYQITSTTDMAPEQARKIIKNGNVSLKAADVQTKMQEITALAESGGGYVESSYVDNIVQPIPMEANQNAKVAVETTTMIANMTIKVPAEKFEGSFQTIIGMGKLVNQSSNSNDITSQYKDIEARVVNLKVQEKHLQEIMTKATNVEDTLKVEVELNRVRTEIDIMTGNLKNWDQLVEYSTIYINMTEVKEAELKKVDMPSVLQNAKDGFISTINTIRYGIEKLFVFLVSAVPYILIVGVALLLTVFWIKKKKK
jgi:anti-sigma factor RsiW